jgi:hypothetical protein
MQAEIGGHRPLEMEQGGVGRAGAEAQGGQQQQAGEQGAEGGWRHGEGSGNRAIVAERTVGRALVSAVQPRCSRLETGKIQ